MADAELTTEEQESFDRNFKDLKDGNDETGNFVKRAIPGDVMHDHLSYDIKKAIAGLTVDQVSHLNDLAAKFKSHIFLHEHDNKPGKIIAMGL